MKRLLRSTSAYQQIAAGAARGEQPHAALVLFPDEKLLRPLLTECAVAFFGAKDGSREARLIEREQFSDCLFFPEAGGKLTADLGARIIDESILRPLEGTKKLFVLDAFHTVTPLVQNKLLKVIEEPPEGVYFLLGAAAEYSVLPTVLSRAVKFAVPPFPEEDIAEALKRERPDASGIEEAAAASGGLYSVAESLVSDGGAQFRLAEEFLLTGEPETFCRTLSDKQDKRLFFAALGQVLRDAAFLALGQEKFMKLKSREIARIAEKYPAGALQSAVGFVWRAEKEIGFNANFAQCALALAVSIGKEKEKWNKLS